MSEYLARIYGNELETMPNPDPTERWVMYASLLAAALGCLLAALIR